MSFTCKTLHESDINECDMHKSPCAHGRVSVHVRLIYAECVRICIAYECDINKCDMHNIHES